MKVVWFCNYSLLYLKDKLNLNLDFSTMHPMPWLYYLACEISKRSELELHIITLKSVVPRDYRICEGNITYHILSELPSFIPRRGVKYIYMIGKLPIRLYWNYKVSKLMKEINPDIVNVHGTEGQLQEMINRFNVPSLIWMQGMMNDVINIQQSKRYYEWLRNENKIIHKQKYFVAFPGDMQTKIKKINPSVKLFTLYHPNPEYAFDLYETKMGTDADMIFVGGLLKRKGIEDYIDAVNIIRGKYPEVKAKIIGFIGNKEYYTEISNKIRVMNLQNNIRFLGFLEEHIDVLKEIKKSKVYVLPTYVDTGPRAVAESMTVGVPVVSYNIDGLPAMINSGEDGILVEKGNIYQLVDAIIGLLNNDKMREVISKNAFEVAKNKYSQKKVVDRLIELYTMIISDFKLSSI